MPHRSRYGQRPAGRPRPLHHAVEGDRQPGSRHHLLRHHRRGLARVLHRFGQWRSRIGHVHGSEDAGCRTRRETTGTRQGDPPVRQALRPAGALLRAHGHLRAENPLHRGSLHHRVLPGIRSLQRRDVPAALHGGFQDPRDSHGEHRWQDRHQGSNRPWRRSNRSWQRNNRPC